MVKTSLQEKKLTFKERYRLRREAGLRGQGELAVTKKRSEIVSPSVKPVSKKAILKHTKRARKAGL